MDDDAINGRGLSEPFTILGSDSPVSRFEVYGPWVDANMTPSVTAHIGWYIGEHGPFVTEGDALLFAHESRVRHGGLFEITRKLSFEPFDYK